MGSYEFRDLTNKGVGTLFEGKIIYDKTYGHVAYGCGTCCGYSAAYIRVFYNPLGVPLQGAAGQGVNAYQNCTLTWDDVSDNFLSRWASANTSIATVDYWGTHNGVSVGSTTSNSSGYLDLGHRAPTCPQFLASVKDSVNTFQGVLTPQDNFSGRSTSRFGIAEVINLSFNAQVTAAALGGLQWSIVSGGGTLTNAGTAGTATYTAPGNQATVVLRLTIVSGQGQHKDYTISIIPPNGGLESTYSNIRHTQGFESVGFLAHIFLQPTDVSFASLQFAEGTTTATASGFFAANNGEVHPASNPPLAISPCDSVIGCQVHGGDQIDSGDSPPPFSIGDFLWQIPWQYKAPTGSLTNFTIVYHHETADANGRGTIAKGGAGPYAKNANDPTTTY